MSRPSIYALVLFTSCLLVSSVGAVDYLDETPGTKITLKGTTVIAGSDSYPVVQTQLTQAPQSMPETSQTMIVHENRTTVGEQEEKIQIRGYAIKPDGIYCVAQSDNPSKKPELLAQPFKLIPIPAEKDTAWDVRYTEDKKKVSLTYRVIDIAEPMTIGDTTYSTLHLQAEGNVSVLGMEIPIRKDVWYDKKIGIIKSVSVQKIMDKETRTEMVFSGM